MSSIETAAVKPETISPDNNIASASSAQTNREQNLSVSTHIKDMPDKIQNLLLEMRQNLKSSGHCTIENMRDLLHRSDVYELGEAEQLWVLNKILIPLLNDNETQILSIVAALKSARYR